MQADSLVPHLVRFGEDQMAVLGKRLGGRYVARCLEEWRESYGESVAMRVREKLTQAWERAK